MNHDGEVVIRGRHSADVVTVTQDWDKVVINYNGSTSSFDGAVVKSLMFKGRHGDDFFENDTAIRAVAKGGGGNDTLIGGTGNDELRGDGGNTSSPAARATTS